ncbi:MAG: DUF5615 family PIN-like protein [Chloroflexota bacterium]|nr:DUF5615 family PIN-like protein [Chloroflexota bacterium]
MKAAVALLVIVGFFILAAANGTLLMDMGFSPSMVDFLREEGFDTIHFHELGLNRASNADILTVSLDLLYNNNNARYTFRWLFRIYYESHVSDWVRKHGFLLLSKRSFPSGGSRLGLMITPPPRGQLQLKKWSHSRVENLKSSPSKMACCRCLGAGLL